MHSHSPSTTGINLNWHMNGVSPPYVQSRVQALSFYGTPGTGHNQVTQWTHPRYSVWHYSQILISRFIGETITSQGENFKNACRI